MKKLSARKNRKIPHTVFVHYMHRDPVTDKQTESHRFIDIHPNSITALHKAVAEKVGHKNFVIRSLTNVKSL